MAYVAYRPDFTFNAKTKALIAQANKFIAKYAKLGMRMTLRQLHYQFVSKTDYYANTMKNYKMLGMALNRGRLAGLVDWDAIVDVTRPMRGVPCWQNPLDAMNHRVDTYHKDRWQNQPYRFMVLIEKDALLENVEKVCQPLDVDYLSCRGFGSQTAIHKVAVYLAGWAEIGQRVVVLHLADHDPSGVDMTRDLAERFEMFAGRPLEVVRLGLTIEQVRRYDLPPNPAKKKDSRTPGYVKKFGNKSWELDAVEPEEFAELIKRYVLRRRDNDLLATIVKQEDKDRKRLAKLRDQLKPKPRKRRKKRKSKKKAKRKGKKRVTKKKNRSALQRARHRR